MIFSGHCGPEKNVRVRGGCGSSLCGYNLCGAGADTAYKLMYGLLL